MVKTKYYRLEFIPTGNIFTLPQDVAVETLKNDRGNYRILDKDFIDEQPITEETTVYNQVVKDETTEKETLDELEALKKEADELGVKYGKTIGIDTLKKRIEEAKAQ